MKFKFGQKLIEFDFYKTSIELNNSYKPFNFNFGSK